MTLALQAARTTAVIVTHDQQEALSMADQVAVLLDGSIAQSATPETLYDSPASLAVATFVGDAVVLSGDVGADGRVRSALGSLAVRAGTQTTPQSRAHVVLRPEQIDVVAVGDMSSGSATTVFGTVVSRSFFGHDGIVRVMLPGGIPITARLHTAQLPAPGVDVGVRVNSPVSVFPAL